MVHLHLVDRANCAKDRYRCCNMRERQALSIPLEIGFRDDTLETVPFSLDPVKKTRAAVRQLTRDPKRRLFRAHADPVENMGSDREFMCCGRSVAKRPLARQLADDCGHTGSFPLGEANGRDTVCLARDDKSQSMPLRPLFLFAWTVAHLRFFDGVPKRPWRRRRDLGSILFRLFGFAIAALLAFCHNNLLDWERVALAWADVAKE
jgi:hypothetical protein